jgi:hypothetical protein
MGLFSRKQKWKSDFYGSANKSFEGVSDKRELMQVALECPHGRIRVQAVARLGDDEALLMELMDIITKKYQDERVQITAKKFTPQTVDRLRAGFLQEAEQEYSKLACPLVWIGRKYPHVIKKWADDPLLAPYAREEAAACMDIKWEESHPIPIHTLGIALKVLHTAPFFFLLILVRLYRVYPEGFIHPQAEWSIDELAQQAAKLPQGEERKLVAAQLVRIVGLNARKGWKDNNLVPEIFESFSAVMPQKDNLRMMWAGLLK